MTLKYRFMLSTAFSFVFQAIFKKRRMGRKRRGKRRRRITFKTQLLWILPDSSWLSLYPKITHTLFIYLFKIFPQLNIQLASLYSLHYQLCLPFWTLQHLSIPSPSFTYVFHNSSKFHNLKLMFQVVRGKIGAGKKFQESSSHQTPRMKVSNDYL